MADEGLLRRIERLEAQVAALMDVVHSASYQASAGIVSRQDRQKRKPRGPPPITGRVAGAVLRVLPGLYEKNGGVVTVPNLVEALGGEKYTRVAGGVRYLARRHDVEYIHSGFGRSCAIVVPRGAARPEPQLSDNQAAFLRVMRVHADGEGLVRRSVRQMSLEIGLPNGRNGTFLTDQLQRKGRIELVDRGSTTVPATWRIMGFKAPVRASIGEETSADILADMIRRRDAPAGRTVTAVLMGDPPPGRSAPPPPPAREHTRYVEGF